MVANKKMPADPLLPPTLGVKRLKFNFFLEKNMLYIKLKGIVSISGNGYSILCIR